MAQPPTAVNAQAVSTKFLTGNPSLTIGPCELSAVGTGANSLVTRGFVDGRAPDLAKGELIVHDPTTDTNARLTVGENGQVLTANSGEDSGLKWATPAPPSSATAPELAQGQLIVHSETAGTNTVLLQGENGQVLTADNGEDSGLVWAVPESVTAPELAQGQLIVHSETAGTNTVLPQALANGQVLVTNSGVAPGLSWAAVPAPATAPELAQGQLIVHSETAGTNTVLPQALANGQVLTANSGQDSGLAWAVVPTPATAPELAQGQLIVHSETAGTNTVLLQGDNDTILVSNSSDPTGLSWASLPAAYHYYSDVSWIQSGTTFGVKGYIILCKVGRLVSIHVGFTQTLTQPADPGICTTNTAGIIDVAYYPSDIVQFPLSYSDNASTGWGTLRWIPGSNLLEAGVTPGGGGNFSGEGHSLIFACDGVYLASNNSIPIP